MLATSAFLLFQKVLGVNLHTLPNTNGYDKNDSVTSSYVGN